MVSNLTQKLFEKKLNQKQYLKGGGEVDNAYIVFVTTNHLAAVPNFPFSLNLLPSPPILVEWKHSNTQAARLSPSNY